MPVDVAALQASIARAAETILDMNKAVGNPQPPGCGPPPLPPRPKRGGGGTRRNRRRRTQRR